MINKAIEFATKAHAGQMRKGTPTPFILHPLEVATIANSILTQMSIEDTDIIQAALLHDVIEDTEHTEEELRANFSKRTVDIVTMQSEDKSKSWKERKQHTIDFLNETRDLEVKIATFSDKLSNMRALYREYQVRGENLWELFNVKVKSEHEWYYRSIWESMRVLSDTMEYKEYERLLSEVFTK